MSSFHVERDIDLGRYRPAFCRRCGAVGTIVDMGYCCRVADLTKLDAVSTKFRPLPPPVHSAQRRKAA